MGFSQGQIQLSVITRCPYYAVVRKAGFDCTFLDPEMNEDFYKQRNKSRLYVFVWRWWQFLSHDFKRPE